MFCGQGEQANPVSHAELLFQTCCVLKPARSLGFWGENLEIIQLKVESTAPPMHLGPCAQNIGGFWCCFMMSNEGNKAEGKGSILCGFEKPKYE